MTRSAHSPTGTGSLKLKTKGASHVVRLQKKDAAHEILINLQWQTHADLDLGCFYALRGPSSSGFLARLTGGTEGPKGVIDGLQFSQGRGGSRDRVTRQGCYTQPPYIWHSGDDRSGAEAADGESILINPLGIGQIERMTIYALIYEGVGQWAETDAVVSVRVPGCDDVIVEMGRQTSPLPFVAIAGLEFLDSDQIRVLRHVTFHQNHSDCDRVYRWGMQWQAGGK